MRKSKKPNRSVPAEEQPSERPAFTGLHMRKPDPIARRDELRCLVVEKGYAPVSAEQVYFDEHRLTFWTVSDEEDRLALLKPYYPWYVAVAWIASQTMQGAAEGIAAFRVWRGRIWRDPRRPGQIRAFRAAEELLKSALSDDQMKARLMGPDDVEVVPHSKWGFLTWKADATGEVVEFEQLLLGDVPRYGPVSISREEIRAVFKPLDEPQTVVAIPPNPAAPSAQEPEVPPDTPAADKTDPPTEATPATPEVSPTAEVPVEQQSGAAVEVDRKARNSARTAAGRRSNSDHAQARLEFLRPHLGLLDRPGGKRKLRKLFDDFQKSKNRKKLGDTAFTNDLDALKPTELGPTSVASDRTDRTTEV